MGCGRELLIRDAGPLTSGSGIPAPHPLEDSYPPFLSSDARRETLPEAGHRVQPAHTASAADSFPKSSPQLTTRAVSFTLTSDVDPISGLEAHQAEESQSP